MYNQRYLNKLIFVELHWADMEDEIMYALQSRILGYADKLLDAVEILAELDWYPVVVFNLSWL